MLAQRRIAAIDVGTNTVRLLAVEFEEDSVNILDESGEVTRLGAGLVGTGTIEDEDATRTYVVLEQCLARARELEADPIDIVGTEVFRAAENGKDVAARFSSQLGHAVRILSADDEAEAAYLGVVGWQDQFDPRPTVVVDMGGGSTQVVLGEGIALSRARSVPIGALRLTEACLKHDPPRPAEVEAARKSAATAVMPLAGFAPRPAKRGGEAHLVGVGGTLCAIGGWVHRVVPYDRTRVEGVRVTRKELAAAVLEWTGMDLATRMERGGMNEGRARVVTGGGILMEALFDTLGIPAIEVSTRGIRHGLVLRRLLLA